MFNIAFPELLIICLVVLIVVGPEKLPKIVHAAGRFLGRMQRYVSDIKSDMNEELRLKDLQILQDELRENVRPGESPKYREGDVIDHRSEQPARSELSQPPINEGNVTEKSAPPEWSKSE